MYGYYPVRNVNRPRPVARPNYHHQQQQQQQNKQVSIVQWKNDLQTQIDKLQQQYLYVGDIMKQGMEIMDFVLEVSEELKNMKKLYESQTPHHGISEQLDFIHSRFHYMEKQIKNLSENTTSELNNIELDRKISDLIIEVRQLQKNYQQIKKITSAASKLIENGGYVEESKGIFPRDTTDIVKELEKKICWVYGTVKNEFLLLYKSPDESTPTKLFYKKAQRILIYYNIVKDSEGNSWVMTRSDADINGTYWIKFIESGIVETNVHKLSVLP